GPSRATARRGRPARRRPTRRALSPARGPRRSPRAAFPSPCLGRDELLDHVALLQELLSRLLYVVPRVIVMLKVGHDLPVLAVASHRESELQALGNPVFAVAHHRQRVPVAPRGWGTHARDRV